MKIIYRSNTIRDVSGETNEWRELASIDKLVLTVRHIGDVCRREQNKSLPPLHNAIRNNSWQIRSLTVRYIGDICGRDQNESLPLPPPPHARRSILTVRHIGDVWRRDQNESLPPIHNAVQVLVVVSVHCNRQKLCCSFIKILKSEVTSPTSNFKYFRSKLVI